MHERMDLHESGLAPALVSRYLKKDPELLSLTAQFADMQGFSSVLDRRKAFRTDRKVLVEALLEQYKCLKAASFDRDQIRSLEDPNTFTVTTGHQLCLATGPLYFFYKILHTISLSQRLEKDLGVKVVPVFWMATEDHDLPEIDHFNAFGRTLTWETEQIGAVGRMSTSGIDAVIHELKEALGELPGADDWISKLRESYSQSNLAAATRELVHDLFGRYGLVIIDGDDPALKRLFLPVIQSELQAPKVRDAVQSADEILEKLGGKSQAYAREINLFYLGDQRERIERTELGFQLVESGKVFSTEELNGLAVSNPERFSPNVILRPLYQEMILPNLCYIGGGGEISYWFQLLRVFEQFKVPFPVLMPRNSFILADSRSMERIKKFGLELKDILKSSDELVKEWVDANVPFDIEKESRQLEELFNGLASKAGAIEPTMEKAVLAEGQRQLNALQGIEKRVLKAAKNKEETEIRQLLSLKEKLFPNGSLQERRANISEFVAFGMTDLQELLLKEMDPIKPEIHLIESA